MINFTERCEKVTVRELINELLNYPMDGEVYVYKHGEYRKIFDDDLSLDAEDDLIINP